MMRLCYMVRFDMIKLVWLLLALLSEHLHIYEYIGGIKRI
jgi:hypothetical protein